MFLENHPEDAERLKKLETFYEWYTYLVATLTYLVTYLPLGVPVYRLGFNILYVFVLIFTVLIFRVIPFERKTGLIRYTIKQKFFFTQLADHYFVSAAVFFTGGVASPLWYIYVLALIMAALVLPAWATIAAGGMSIGLYLFTVAFLTPYFTGLYAVGLTAKMVIVPLSSILAVILTFVVAKDLNLEISRIRKLAKGIMGERNKLNTVVTAVADGIFVLDKAKKFTFINKAAWEILKFGEEDIINKRFDEVIKAVDTQNNKQVKAAQICPSGVVLEDKILFGPAELRIKMNTNKDVWVRLISSGIKEGTDIDVACICTFQDISKEKELEEMKLDFVSMAAHELRTPLTAVRGYLSILLEEKNRDPEEQGWLKKAFISTNSLASLVENLLSIARIEKHSLKLELVNSDWQEILKGAVENFQQQAEEKSIDMTLDIKEKLPKISVDKFRVSEVLSNLLANALNYSKPGSKVKVSSFTRGNDIITSISDTGEGIPESALPRLFTKFFRVSGVLEQGSKGTGLGLYISKAVIEMHHGKIWVESKLGVGSTFSFSLPIRQKLFTTEKKDLQVHA